MSAVLHPATWSAPGASTSACWCLCDGDTPLVAVSLQGRTLLTLGKQTVQYNRAVSVTELPSELTAAELLDDYRPCAAPQQQPDGSWLLRKADKTMPITVRFVPA